jgi:hypothetical protein
MRRNPSAKTKEKVKTAQKKQRPGRPKMKPTTRSKRGGGAVPARSARILEHAARVEDTPVDPIKWNTNKVKVAGDQVEFLTPTNPGIGRGPDGGRPPQSYGGPKITKGMTDEEYKYAYEEGLMAHKLRNASRLLKR